MSLNSYNRINSLKEQVFDKDVYNLRNSLANERGDRIYETAITRTNLNARYQQLPIFLQKKLNKHKNILEVLREKEAGKKCNEDDLDLPSLNNNTTASPTNAMVIKSPSGTGLQTLGYGFIGQRKSEDLFANELIVPKVSEDASRPLMKTHPTWKLFRVLVGHTGQVTALEFDPNNEYFATGSSDRTIKIWNLASGQLMHTLTGHIMGVRGIAISDRHPYMFSCSEDKSVKCWDLEKNKVIRDYHGHLSSVYTIDIHPTLDLIVTGSRDSSVKVWDIRTRLPVYTLTGHKNTVNKVCCRATDPQIISCSMDSTVKTWDLIAGKCSKTLTYHSKSVRTFCCNSDQDEFVSGSADGLKKFKLPNCDYLQNMELLKHDQFTEGNLLLNTNCSNSDGEMFVGCDNGQYGFWDWDTGRIFQNGINEPIAGSMDSERGILCSSFDKSGIRLVTGNVDKTIRMWKPEVQGN